MGFDKEIPLALAAWSTKDTFGRVSKGHGKGSVVTYEITHHDWESPEGITILPAMTSRSNQGAAGSAMIAMIAMVTHDMEKLWETVGDVYQVFLCLPEGHPDHICSSLPN